MDYNAIVTQALTLLRRHLRPTHANQVLEKSGA